MAEPRSSKSSARASGAGARSHPTVKAKSAPAGPGFTLSLRWAAVILGVLVVVFFHDVALGGKTFVSPDATAPAGFVRMGEQALFHDHVYPLWNPFVFLGMPSFASGAYNPLIYPPDWPLGLVQKVLPLPDMTWMLIYYFLGGLFLFLLAREWGARPEGALLGAAAFVFAPNLVAVGSHGHGSQLVDSAYAPLLLWLAARWLRRGGVHHLAWLALAGGFQMLRGHVQICFYTWMAVVLYAAVEWIATAVRRRAALGAMTARVLGIGVAAVLAFGLAGFYNLPLRDYAKWSIRGGTEGGGVGMDYATAWSFAPYELPSVLFPSYVGFGGETYWGGMPFTDYPNAYLGMVAVVLLVPAFLANGAPRVFALILGALALMISFGKHFPLYPFLYAHLPLFNKFRVPVMVVLLFQVAAALGTAWGWSAVLQAADAKKKEGSAAAVDRVLVGLAVALALVFVAGVLGHSAWERAYLETAMRHRMTEIQFGAQQQAYSPEIAARALMAFTGDLAKASMLGLLVVGAAWLARRRTLPAMVATGVVLIALLFELWPVSNRVMAPVVGDPVPKHTDFGRDDVIDFLEKQGPPGTFRIAPFDELQSNRFAGFGIASIGGYHAAKTRLIQDWNDRREYGNPYWLRLLGVKYVVVRQPYDPSMIPATLKVVYQSETGQVLENLSALPRVTVLGRYRVVTPAKAILDSISGGRIDAAQETILEHDPGLRLGPVEGARASIVSYRLNDVTIDVDTPGPALLRLADLWYPDWTATVNGTQVKILQADDLLRAVPVPAGHSRVVFRFRSPAVRAGLQVSIASLVIILLGFGWSLIERVRRRRTERPAPAGATPAAGGA